MHRRAAERSAKACSKRIVYTLQSFFLLGDLTAPYPLPSQVAASDHIKKENELLLSYLAKIDPNNITLPAEDTEAAKVRRMSGAEGGFKSQVAVGRSESPWSGGHSRKNQAAGALPSPAASEQKPRRDVFLAALLLFPARHWAPPPPRRRRRRRARRRRARRTSGTAAAARRSSSRWPTRRRVRS